MTDSGVIISTIPMHLKKPTSTGHLSKINQEIRWLFLNKASVPGHEHTMLLREAGNVNSHRHHTHNNHRIMNR